MDLQNIIDDVIVKLKKEGYDVEASYCLSEEGKLISFTITIIGWFN